MDTDIIEYHLFKEFEMYFPNLAKQVVSVKEHGHFSLVVKTVDGESYLYNGLHKTCGPMFRDSRYNEQSWRREFAYNLNDMMRFKNCSREELSSLSGISLNTINKYINGISTPSTFHTTRLITSLHCQYNDLIPN